MAMQCPHCSSPAHTRTSRYMSPTCKESYMQCSNLRCGFTFVSITEVARTLSPSATPNPRVFIPIAQRKQAPPDENQLELAVI